MRFYVPWTPAVPGMQMDTGDVDFNIGRRPGLSEMVFTPTYEGEDYSQEEIDQLKRDLKEGKIDLDEEIRKVYKRFAVPQPGVDIEDSEGIVAPPVESTRSPSSGYGSPPDHQTISLPEEDIQMAFDGTVGWGYDYDDVEEKETEEPSSDNRQSGHLSSNGIQNSNECEMK